jgi:hypothetical protein
MPLIHTYDYKDGGLADTIRSFYAYYIFCKKNDIKYYIYFPENHPFSLCFEKHNIPKEYLVDIMLIVNMSASVNSDTLLILDHLKKNKEKNFAIRSNVFEFIPFEDLEKYIDEFFNFLQITDIIKNRIEFLIKDIKKPFVSIHARLGDKFMSDVNCVTDTRIEEPFAIETEKNFKKLFDDLSIRYPGHSILFFSDNDFIKKKFKEIYSVTILDTIIHHVSLDTKNKMQGSIDAISEFYILGLSDSISILSKSGIPYWAAYFNKKPLYALRDNVIFEYDKIEYFEEYHRPSINQSSG